MAESAQEAKLARIWSFDAVSCPGVLRRVHSFFRIVQELICAATRAVPTSSKVFARAACLCKDGLCTTQLNLEILGQLVAVSDKSSNRRLHFFLASSAITAGLLPLLQLSFFLLVLLSLFLFFCLSPCAFLRREKDDSGYYRGYMVLARICGEYR